VTPAAPRARTGNRNTAARWAAFLRGAGHRVTIEQQWSGESADLMIALHARRSAESIRRYAASFPMRPLVVALTGTDLYRDIETDRDAQASLQLATKLVTLQEMGADAVPPALRDKVHVVYQSARTIARPPPLASSFEIVVSGHLREEKDPFRAAAALAHLPAASRIRVTHIGGAMSADMGAQAREWMAREPRYRWMGERPHWRALRLLGRSRVMVISSRMEGGANVVSEALALGVPVIASDVPGNVGMLGRGYPGYFPLGAERSLAALLWRAEHEPEYYAALERACRARAYLVTADREAASLNELVREVSP
jgi:putative glycosyltransferase (TIGR04348 family)